MGGHTLVVITAPAFVVSVDASVVAAPCLKAVIVRPLAVQELLDHAAPQAAAVIAHGAADRAHGGRVRQVSGPPHHEAARPQVDAPHLTPPPAHTTRRVFFFTSGGGGEWELSVPSTALRSMARDSHLTVTLQLLRDQILMYHVISTALRSMARDGERTSTAIER